MRSIEYPNKGVEIGGVLVPLLVAGTLVGCDRASTSKGLTIATAASPTAETAPIFQPGFNYFPSYYIEVSRLTKPLAMENSSESASANEPNHQENINKQRDHIISALSDEKGVPESRARAVLENLVLIEAPGILSGNNTSLSHLLDSEQHETYYFNAMAVDKKPTFLGVKSMFDGAYAILDKIRGKSPDELPLTRILDFRYDRIRKVQVGLTPTGNAELVMFGIPGFKPDKLLENLQTRVSPPQDGEPVWLYSIKARPQTPNSFINISLTPGYVDLSIPPPTRSILVKSDYVQRYITGGVFIDKEGKMIGVNKALVLDTNNHDTNHFIMTTFANNPISSIKV